MSGPTAPELDAVFGRSGTGPLSGILVADFSRILAGPYCTMLLADMGATVIKVESPAGDDTRTWKPPVRNDESTYFLSVNRNKHSIALDLGSADDLAVARELARRADVVIENFKPGGLASFGLDYAAVSATNPRVVYSSITGFGTDQGAGLPGYDLLVQAVSGMMSLTGAPDTSPFRAGVAIFDVMAGLHACIGILASLNHRTVSGEGQNVELNLLSSALSGMVNQTAAYAAGGVIPERMGNEHPSLYPYEPMQTGSGELIIAAGNDSQFTRLCATLGLDELASDPRYATMALRNANRTSLRPILLEKLAERSANEWFEILSAVGLPCAPILDVRGGLELAEKLGLRPVVTAGPDDTGVPTVRHPIDFSRTPASYELPPPELNASSDLVREWLRSGGKHLKHDRPDSKDIT